MTSAARQEGEGEAPRPRRTSPGELAPSLVGKKFGELQVLAVAPPRIFPSGQLHSQVEARCSCGTTGRFLAAEVRRGARISCSPCAKRRHTEALTGRKRGAPPEERTVREASNPFVLGARTPSGRPLAELSKETGLSVDTLRMRLKRGWPEAELGAPLGTKLSVLSPAAPVADPPVALELPAPAEPEPKPAPAPEPKEAPGAPPSPALKAALVVGGVPGTVRDGIAPLLAEHGLEVRWHWDIASRRSSWGVPPSCEVVVILTDSCQHSDASRAKQGALLANVPCVLTVRKKVRLEQDLKRRGFQRLSSLSLYDKPLTASLEAALEHKTLRDTLDHRRFSAALSDLREAYATKEQDMPAIPSKHIQIAPTPKPEPAPAPTPAPAPASPAPSRPAPPPATAVQEAIEQAFGPRRVIPPTLEGRVELLKLLVRELARCDGMTELTFSPKAGLDARFERRISMAFEEEA